MHFLFQVCHGLYQNVIGCGGPRDIVSQYQTGSWENIVCSFNIF